MHKTKPIFYKRKKAENSAVLKLHPHAILKNIWSPFGGEYAAPSINPIADKVFFNSNSFFLEVLPYTSITYLYKNIEFITNIHTVPASITLLEIVKDKIIISDYEEYFNSFKLNTNLLPILDSRVVDYINHNYQLSVDFSKLNKKMSNRIKTLLIFS